MPEHVGTLAFTTALAAKRVRGWISYSDAFFPLAVLNLGQASN